MKNDIANEWSLCHGQEDESGAGPHEPNPCQIVDGGALCVECGGFIPDDEEEVS